MIEFYQIVIKKPCFLKISKCFPKINEAGSLGKKKKLCFSNVLFSQNRDFKKKKKLYLKNKGYNLFGKGKQ